MCIRDRVLYDENADDDAPVEGAQLTPLFENFRRHDSTGESERGSEQQRGRRLGTYAEPQQRIERDHHQSQVDEAARRDLESQDVADAQLEAHREQQEQHAEMSDVLERRS